VWRFGVTKRFILAILLPAKPLFCSVAVVAVVIIALWCLLAALSGFYMLSLVRA